MAKYLLEYQGGNYISNIESLLMINLNSL